MKNSAYKKHLKKDIKLKSILDHEIALPGKSKDTFLYLVTAIIAQQLATKVAQILEKRFISLFEGKKPSPKMVLEKSVLELRSIGLSQKKVEYIFNVAHFFIENKVNSKKINQMTDEEVIEYFCSIKGIGRWTVQMLLIFGLGREDVFARDDLGIQKAMIKIFKISFGSKKDFLLKIEKISSKWTPYRTYACLYLWKSLEDQ